VTPGEQLRQRWPFRPELAPGARNAVVSACAFSRRKSHADYRPRLPRDRRRAGRRARKVGWPYNAWILEELAPRPLTDMPRAVLDDMETSQVSIFAVRAQANELRTRMQMTDVVNRRKMRHAHMVNIDRRIMLKACAPISTRWTASARRCGAWPARRARFAPPPAGTNIVADFESGLQVAQDQRHHQPE
jgi:aminopeptidase